MAAGSVDRLVNVASSVYGKVYFPVRSNGLKPLGRFLGAGWTDPQASGLQSLVWRHRWEMTRDERFKQSLLQYNREDCEAVRLLVDRLDQIRRDAASDPTIEFASRPKRHATETGKAVHGQFERILKSARGRTPQRSGNPSPQKDAGGRRIPEKQEGRERAIQRSAGSFRRRPAAVSSWNPAERCPRARRDLVPKTGQIRPRRRVIDLVFTRSGCRKAVTRY